MLEEKIRKVLRNTPRYHKFMNELNKLVQRDPIQIQEETLKNILNHCYEKVPFYKRQFKQIGYNPQNYKGLQDLEKIPFIDKKTVKDNYQDLIAKAPLHQRLFSTKGKTSGTTGSPAHFLRDLNSIICEEASINWHWSLSGWPGPGMKKIAVLRGIIVKNINESKKIFWDVHDDHLILSSLHLNDKNLEFYIEKLKEFKPHILRAYPSTAYLLAKYLEDQDSYLEIPYVYTSSEPFYPVQKALIKKRLNTKIMDFYGQAERVVFGFQPHPDFENELVLLPNYSIAELVDYDENGNGVIVGTTLTNDLMPLIRYRTDDRSKFAQNNNSFFEKWQRIEPIYTKNEDYIIMNDGRKIPGSLVTFVFKDFPEIIKSKIIQYQGGSIEILIVKSSKFSKEKEKKFLKSWKDYINPDVPIQIESVDTIPLNSNAKFKWIETGISLPEKSLTF